MKDGDLLTPSCLSRLPGAAVPEGRTRAVVWRVWV